MLHLFVNLDVCISWSSCLFSFDFFGFMNFFRTSQFIISVNKYLEAVNNAFSVGMRFKMRFEGEDSPERRWQHNKCFGHWVLPLFNLVCWFQCTICLVRFTGTIVGVGDISQEWSKSKWRSLKVEKSFLFFIFLMKENFIQPRETTVLLTEHKQLSCSLINLHTWRTKSQNKIEANLKWTQIKGKVENSFHLHS